MKKLLLLPLILTMLSTANARVLEEYIPQYVLLSSTLDSTLASGTSVYQFNFQNGTASQSQRVIYSIDGVPFTKDLVGNKLIISSNPGKHIFQFYYSSDFAEVYTDSLMIQDRYHNTYNVNLWFNNVINVSDKPVIYLYPTEETSVSVNMDIVGETSFTYPLLADSWDFIASPNGDLKFGDKTYNYLFWESHQNQYLNHVQRKEGFIVNKNDVVSFLEEKLTEAGLSSKEQADFITYWGPRLSANEMTFVHFEFNEECDRYAKMEITPTPDNIYRIYMSWMPITEPTEVTPQTIQKMNRSGFTVLEWGGSEVVQPNNLVSN